MFSPAYLGSIVGFGTVLRDAPRVQDWFGINLWQGNGRNNRKISTKADMSNGMVWVKNQNITNISHQVVDSVRGVPRTISTDTNAAEVSNSDGIMQLNSDHYQVGDDSATNRNTTSTVFRHSGFHFKQEEGFFDMVSWAGYGTATAIPHNLGVKPAMMIVKGYTTSTRAWSVYHQDLGATKYGWLDADNNFATSSAYWNNTEPTDTHFTVGNSSHTNVGGTNYIAYLFASNEDKGINCGSYTGDGATSTSIELGWKPQWILVKVTSIGSSTPRDSWHIYDAARGTSVAYFADTTAVSTSAPYMEFTDTGFTVTGNLNMAQDYIYMAIREDAPTDETMGIYDIIKDLGLTAHLDTVLDVSDPACYNNAVNAEQLTNLVPTGQHTTFTTSTSGLLDYVANGKESYVQFNASAGTNGKLVSDVGGIPFIQSIHNLSLYGQSALMIANRTEGGDASKLYPMWGVWGNTTGADGAISFHAGNRDEFVTGWWDTEGRWSANVGARSTSVGRWCMFGSSYATSTYKWPVSVFSPLDDITPIDKQSEYFTTAGSNAVSPLHLLSVTGANWNQARDKMHAYVLWDTELTTYEWDKLDAVFKRRYYLPPPPPEPIANVFSIDIWAGDSVDGRDITNGIDTSSSKALIWLKDRNYASNSRHFLFDTDRGIGNYIQSNATTAQTTDSDTLRGFNSNGYRVGDDPRINAVGNDYVGWTFRESTGFLNILNYTGDGISGRILPHRLDATFGMAIIKSASSITQWAVQHKDLDPSGYLRLNQNIAITTDTSVFNSTSASNDEITVGQSVLTNSLNGNYVAYVFAHSPENGIFCGKHTGTGVAGEHVELGWQPQYILYKAATTTSDWFIYDMVRGFDRVLFASTDAVEVSSSVISATATGFTVNTTSSSFNGVGEEYIFMAIKEA